MDRWRFWLHLIDRPASIRIAFGLARSTTVLEVRRSAGRGSTGDRAQRGRPNISRAQVWRDIYYIAVPRNIFNEYREEDLRVAIASIPDPAVRLQLSQAVEAPQSVIPWIYSRPDMWDKTDLFAKRASMDFQLEGGSFSRWGTIARPVRMLGCGLAILM